MPPKDRAIANYRKGSLPLPVRRGEGDATRDLPRSETTERVPTPWLFLPLKPSPMPKLTIHDLFEAKKTGRTFTEIRTSDLREAIACAEAGVEIIMCMKEDLPGDPPGCARCVHHRRAQCQSACGVWRGSGGGGGV